MKRSRLNLRGFAYVSRPFLQQCWALFSCSVSLWAQLCRERFSIFLTLAANVHASSFLSRANHTACYLLPVAVPQGSYRTLMVICENQRRGTWLNEVSLEEYRVVEAYIPSSRWSAYGGRHQFSSDSSICTCLMALTLTFRWSDLSDARIILTIVGTEIAVPL